MSIRIRTIELENTKFERIGDDIGEYYYRDVPTDPTDYYWIPTHITWNSEFCYWMIDGKGRFETCFDAMKAYDEAKENPIPEY